MALRIDYFIDKQTISSTHTENRFLREGIIGTDMISNIFPASSLQWNTPDFNDPNGE